MKCVKQSATVIIVFFINYVGATAQINLSKYEVGLSGGIMLYQGDVTPERFGAFKTMKPQIALHLYRKLNTAFALRLNINQGSLRGDDAKYANPDWRQQRNFGFKSPVTEVSLQGVWGILENKSPRFSPYIFAGAGITLVNIKRNFANYNATYFGENSEVTAGLAQDVSTPLPRVIAVAPVGAGVRYFLNDKFSLIAESNYRLSFTDYLDGFSKAVNPKLRDHYLTHSVGVVYSFSKKIKGLGCPSVL
jgi:hypothetical protein